MQRNIVVIVLDSVRKDFFDKFAPKLSDMADVSLSHCRAASNWSPPSHGAMVTGSLPSVSGIHSHDPSYEGTPSEKTFFDALDEYYNFGISSNLFVSEFYGFDEYFDDFTGISRDAVFARGGDIDTLLQDIDQDGIKRYWKFLKQAIGADQTTMSVANGLTLKINDIFSETRVPRLWDFGTRTSLKHAEEKILANRTDAVFGFINLMETHNPHANNIFYDSDTVPNSWSSSQYNTYEFNNQILDDDADIQHINYYEALYGESIKYVDSKLIQFFKRIQSQTDRETTFIVTADHGENLGEQANDGLLGHIGNLSEALLHVPLLIFNPPEEFEEPSDSYFSLLDFPALITGLVDDKLDIPYRDRVPVEVVGSAPPENIDRYDYWDRMQRALYQGGRKYVWDTNEKYVCEIDRNEACKQKRLDESWAEDMGSDFFETSIEQYKGKYNMAQSKAWGEDAPVGRLKELGYL